MKNSIFLSLLICTGITFSTALPSGEATGNKPVNLVLATSLTQATPPAITANISTGTVNPNQVNANSGYSQYLYNTLEYIKSDPRTSFWLCLTSAVVGKFFFLYNTNFEQIKKEEAAKLRASGCPEKDIEAQSIQNAIFYCRINKLLGYSLLASGAVGISLSIYHHSEKTSFVKNVFWDLVASVKKNWANPELHLP